MNVQATQADITAKKKKERWKDLFEAACAEKKWINERLAWLFTPQAVLFATVGITLTNTNSSLAQSLRTLRICISIVGVVIAVVVFLCVLAAAIMHQKWTHEMQEIAEQIPNDVTFGNHPHWPSRLARWAPMAIPFLFFGVWLWLLFTV